MCTREGGSSPSADRSAARGAEERTTRASQCREEPGGTGGRGWTTIREKHIRCPFWRAVKDRVRTVGCEGLVERSTLLMRFEDPRDQKIQVRVFCADRYENCELYRAIVAARYPED